jgi:hypothetical protein
VSTPSSAFVAYYGPDSHLKALQASFCAVLSGFPDTRLVCTSAEGVGQFHRWTLIVGGQQVGPTTATTSYGEPTISSISTGNGDGTHNTDSTTSITLYGTNFGPVSSSGIWAALQVTRTVSLGASSPWNQIGATCTQGAHTVLYCSVSPGVGTNFQWSVTVAGQNIVSTATTSYRRPSISSYSLSEFPTIGGTQIEIYGSNFGPAAVLGSLAYGPSSSSNKYSAQNCAVVSAHNTIRCTTQAGVGAALAFVVRIGGQDSVNNPASLRYVPPSIASMLVDGSTSGQRKLTTRGKKSRKRRKQRRANWKEAKQPGRFFVFLVAHWLVLFVLSAGSLFSLFLFPGFASSVPPGGQRLTIQGSNFPPLNTPASDWSVSFQNSAFAPTGCSLISNGGVTIECATVAGEETSQHGAKPQNARRMYLSPQKSFDFD